MDGLTEGLMDGQTDGRRSVRQYPPTPRDLIIIPGGRFIRTPGKSFCLVPRPIGGDVLLGRSDNFSATRKFFRRRENFEKKSLERRDRFRQKIVKIGAILAIFEPFEGWKIRVPFFMI